MRLENLTQAGTAKFFYRQDNNGDLWLPYNGLITDFGKGAELIGGQLSSKGARGRRLSVQEVCVCVMYLYFLLHFLIPHAFIYKGI